MNLYSLSTQVMLQHSREWLSDGSVREILIAHPLGEPLLTEIERAHHELLHSDNLRSLTVAEIEKLTALMDVVDDRHDDMARALYWGLQALVHADPNSAVACHDAQQNLFPDGLRVIELPYADESSAALAMKERVSDELIAFLDATPLGVTTLGALYREWLAAGEKLGTLYQKRVQLEVAVSADQDARPRQSSGRQAWIEATRALLAALDLMQLTVEQREQTIGALQKSVYRSQRERAQRAQNERRPDNAPDLG